MRHVTLNARLTLAGPILTRSTASGRPGIDAPMARTRGRYYLPYSLVRGRLRQSLEELAGAGASGLSETLLDDWFGPRGLTSYEPQRARLRFEDFLAAAPPPTRGAVRVRIRMDAERGAADVGALQMIESPYAPGEEVVFRGTIAFHAESDAHAREVHRWIALGLRWTTGFGAGRSLGFGRLVRAEVRLDASAEPAPEVVETDADGRLGLEIRPHAPFCIARYVPDTNLFESDAIVPGGVVRGVLATLLKRLAGRDPNEPLDVADLPLPDAWKALGTHFDAIRVTHAFPAPESDPRRPVEPPLSLVKATFPGPEKVEQRWFDVALSDGPVLLGVPPRAPTFAIDWKDHHDVRSAFGWAVPQRELRVRTAIEAKTRRARDAQLFAYEMVVPDGFVWLAQVDLSRVPDAARAAVARQLQELFRGGLTGFGKTKAVADVKVARAAGNGEYFAEAPTPDDGLRVLTLQTPALLCNPALLDEESGETELRDAYRESWDDLSEKSLTLVRFFARQRLAGGYLALRFQPGRPYNPFLVTEAGSVFVLQAVAGKEEAAAEWIAAWRKFGLPLPEWARTLYAWPHDSNVAGPLSRDHWRTCPFRTVDGYGEVAVDLPCQRDDHRAPPRGPHA